MCFSLSHTVRAHSSTGLANLKLFALTESDQTSPEEVQSLFYTKDTLFSLPKPEVIPKNFGKKENELLASVKDKIFQCIDDDKTCTKHEVNARTATVLDNLVGVKKLTINSADLNEDLSKWVPNVAVSVLMQVLEDLKKTGNLIAAGIICFV